MIAKRLVVYCAFCILLAFMLSGCLGIENTIISESVSPDGKYVAVIFSRDVGATTTKSYNLSIIENGDKLEAAVGNAFHSDSDFSVEWLENEKILVTINNSSKRIITQNEEVGNVMIEYTYNAQ